MSLPHIAFLGLGNMGEPMAKNLLGAGYRVNVWNRSREKTIPLEEAGAVIASSIAEAVRTADIVITMLANDQALEQVTAGPDGIIANLKLGGIHIGCSTVSPGISRRLAERHADHGQKYLAAPVLGRPDAAATKRLTILAAGPADVLAQVRPVFDALGQRVAEFGNDPGAANVAKLCMCT